MNDANLDPSLIRARQGSLRAFLAPFLSSDQALLDIADLGGDAGQFIPLALARRAYLIEASEQTPVPGVVRVGGLAHLPHDLDLLICAHVLEHVPAPISFLGAQIESPRIRSGCLIYLEVPLEHCGISDWLRSKFYARYLRAVSRIRSVLLVVDFLSLLARAYLGRIFPPLIIKMHEHVNFLLWTRCKHALRTWALSISPSSKRLALFFPPIKALSAFWRGEFEWPLPEQLYEWSLDYDLWESRFRARKRTLDRRPPMRRASIWRDKRANISI